MPKIIENLSARLTEEARKQAMEGGYTALNIRAVAKNCGVGVGTVYSYFPSKDALIAGFLLEDWMECLARIRETAEQRSDIFATLEAIRRELEDFLARYSDLFRSAESSVQMPFRKYHTILRGQLSSILLPMCPDPFTADFICESMLVWTMEGVPFSGIRAIIEKILR